MPITEYEASYLQFIQTKNYKNPFSLHSFENHVKLCYTDIRSNNTRKYIGIADPMLSEFMYVEETLWA